MLGIAAVAGVWADRLYSEPNIEGHGVAKAWCTVLACQVAAVLPPPCRARAAQVKVLHRIGLYSKLVLCSPVLASQFQWNAWIVHSTVPPVWWWAEALAVMESWLWSENSSLASAEPAESGPVLESHHRQRYQTFLSCFLCSFPSSGTAYSTNSMPLSLCISWISCTAGLCGIYPAYIGSPCFFIGALLCLCSSWHNVRLSTKTNNMEPEPKWCNAVRASDMCVATERLRETHLRWNLQADKNILLSRFAYLCISAFWRVRVHNYVYNSMTILYYINCNYCN